MASKHACPYCKGAISEQLAAFGGPCPHCLLEVPGDEAPTDPGLARQQQLDREAVALRADDTRRSRRLAIGAMASFAAVITFVIWTVFGGGYDTLAIAYYQQLDPAALQRKRAEQLAEAEAARQQEQAQAQAKAAEAARRTGAAQRPAGGASGGGGLNPLDGLEGILNGGGGGGSLDALGAPVIAGAGSTSLGGGGLVGGTAGGGPTGVAVGTVSLAGSTGRTALTGTSVQMASTQKVVESPKDAETMISERFYKFERQLQACWAPQIKLNPTLSGTWSVAFVVKPDGTVANVRVKATSTPNAAFESCAVGRVQTWTFLPVAKDTPYDDVVSY